MIFFQAISYFLSFIFPKYFWAMHYFCVPTFNLYKNFKDVWFRETLIFLFFIFPISLWAFIYNNCSPKIFIFLFYSFILLTLIIFIFYFIFNNFFKKFIKNYFILDIFLYSLLRMTLYFFLGNIFMKGFVFPFYYSISPNALYKNTLPLWSIFYFKNLEKIMPWIYLFFNNLIVLFLIKKIYKKKYFILIFAFLSIYFGSFKKDFILCHELKNIDEVENIIKKKDENYVCFEEDSITLDEVYKIEKLIKISKKYNKNLIFGAGIFFENENNKKIEKFNCAIHLLNGNIKSIKNKSHKINFCETRSDDDIYYKNTCIKKDKENNLKIKICSDLIMYPVKIKKNNKKRICIYSNRWTNTIFSKIYNSMIDIIIKINNYN